MTCLVCDGATLKELVAYRDLSRITSDCRSFPSGGRLFSCTHCGAVQKINDKDWRSDCDQIYGQYDVYSVSQGQEQSVRSGKSNAIYGKRSDLILSELSKVIDLPDQGACLDFGCGSGVSSRAVSKALEGWAIDGFDLDQRMEAELISITGFNKLYVGDIESIGTQYDLIMLTHVLEHLPEPAETLQNLSRLLKPDGAIVVQVPNRAENIYDLLVADHLLHFDVNSLTQVCQKSKCDQKVIADDWVKKELSLVMAAKDPAGEESASHTRVDVPEASQQVEELSGIAESLNAIDPKTRVGFFGTSLAATWMTEELGRKPSFYVDEDPSKIGQYLNEVEIMSPSDVPAGAMVILAMAEGVGQIIAERYTDAPFDILTVAELAQKRT